MTVPACPTCEATDSDANPWCRNAFHYVRLGPIPTTPWPVHDGPMCQCTACELERTTDALMARWVHPVGADRVRRDPDGGRALDGPGPAEPFIRKGTDPDDY